MYACIHKYTHIHTQNRCMSTYICTYIYTQWMHIYIHTHTKTYIHRYAEKHGQFTCVTTALFVHCHFHFLLCSSVNNNMIHACTQYYLISITILSHQQYIYNDQHVHKFQYNIAQYISLIFSIQSYVQRICTKITTIVYILLFPVYFHDIWCQRFFCCDLTALLWVSVAYNRHK